MRDARAAALFATLGALAAIVACRPDNSTGPDAQLAAQQNSHACNGLARCSLAFTTQPADSRAGATLPLVAVTLLDAAGNPVTDFTGRVAIALGTNPTGATLTGTRAVRAVAGVASFADLRIDRPGAGYTLAASSGHMNPGQSAAFAIGGPATHLAFTVQPSNATAGNAIAPAIQVSALDVNGNPATDFAGSITVAITTGSGTPGAILVGTVTRIAGQGVAAFGDLAIDKSGSGYQLSASAAGLAPATSAAFDVAHAPASRLAFVVQPSNTAAGTSITPAVGVAALDPFGNLDPDYPGAITLALAANPAGGTLSGTLVQLPGSGIAHFANLSIDLAGSGYTLAASAAGLVPATSAAFQIVSAAATHLAFTVQPSNVAAGAAIAPAITVTALDANNNPVPGFVAPVTIAIALNPGGGTLSGTTTLLAIAGVATFSTLSLDKAGVGYKLSASAAGLPPVTSAAFQVVQAPATRLRFIVQPTSTVAGNPFVPAVQVEAIDPFGNRDAGFAGAITIAIATNAGGGTLSGTFIQAPSLGVASFANLSIDKAGSGYSLIATTAGLTGATSAAFNIVSGAAIRLHFITQPTNTAAAVEIVPSVQVAAEDAFGNVAAGFGGNVTIGIAVNPSGGVLSGTTTVATVAGIATFSHLSINLAGNGYSLGASSPGLTGETSASFNVF